MKKITSTLGAILVLSLVLPAAAAAQSFESYGVRSAREILPPALQRGKHFKVRDDVISYDYLHHYTVDSDFGVFEATGDGALRKLAGEIAAIAVLREVTTSEAVLQSAKQAVTAPIELGKSLIKNPVDTVSGLPSGVFQIFENVAESVTMEHDPSEDAKIKQALFVSSWKRDFAAERGIDVYTSNKVLQKELNRVGWAAAISSLALSAATLGTNSTAVIVAKNMRLANQVKNALKEEPPSRLRLMNEEKLKKIGVRDDLVQRYLDHLAFTPRHDTIIVESLSQMAGVSGRDRFVEHMLVANNEVGANFFQQTAETMLGYHQSVSLLVDIQIVGGLVVAKAKNGAALIPFPLDHGLWTARAKSLIEHVRANYKAAGFNGTFELWVTGTVSPRANKELTTRGFNVTENIDGRVGFMD